MADEKDPSTPRSRPPVRRRRPRRGDTAGADTTHDARYRTRWRAGRGREACAGCAAPAPRRPRSRRRRRRLAPPASWKWTTVRWVAFSAACTSGLVASTRASCSPTSSSSRPSPSRPASPAKYNGGRGRHALEGRLRRLDRARPRGLLRADRGVHPPRLLAELAAPRRTSSSAPATAAASTRDGRQLRRPGPAAAGARAHRARRRRPDPGRQVGEVPAGEGRVDKAESFLKV